MTDNLFDLKGKNVLVIGGATGMGAAVAQLAAAGGASISVLDVAPVPYPTQQSLKIDLRDQSNVDSVLDSLEGNFDVVFSCAGVAQDTPGIILINFISQRHIIETLFVRKQLSIGGSVVLISSAAGLGWRENLPQLKEFLETPDWTGAANWVENNETPEHYTLSKQAINAYVASNCYKFVKQGVRLNAVLPGPTDTPLARANADTWLTFGQAFREDIGLPPLSPQQIASTMVFLASEAGSGVNGQTLLVDYGHIPSGITGVIDDPAVKYLTGS